MHLGINLGYFGLGKTTDGFAIAQEADRLGYSSCWAAEVYGSDAATVLAYVASKTERIDIGSAIFQIPARTPAMTAMTAATLDMLSGGRFRLGLGVSGPQVSEGWYGARFEKPLGRTREFVGIVRKALARERLTYSGEHWTLPLPDGPGKALKLTIGPDRHPLPIYIAAIGPKNLEQTGQIAEGWLGIFFAPEHAEVSLGPLREGRGGSLEGFDVAPTVPVTFTRTDSESDLRAAADAQRAYTALYIGGMGSRSQNFYNQLACRMGYEDAAVEIQEKYTAGDTAGAQAAVPHGLIDATTLIGTKERVADRLHAYADAGVTTLIASHGGAAPGGVGPALEERMVTLRTLVEAAELAGV